MKSNLAKIRYLIAALLIAVMLLFAVSYLAYQQYTNQQKLDDLDQIYKDYNVILVAFDALQVNHTGVYGYYRDTTPNLDAFARDGFVFDEAISPSSWTVPTYVSWFTSLYPSQHKVTNKFSVYKPPITVMANFRNLTSPDVKTLAEVLKDNGYSTVAFTGDAGARGSSGNNIGFDTYIDTPAGFNGFDYSLPMAASWLQNNSGRKFFMFVHGYDSHGQYQPKNFTGRFLDFDYDGKYNGTVVEQAALREAGLANGSLDVSVDDIRFWRAWYDEKISAADERFGSFISKLDSMGLMERTIIIVASDHGTEFFEHQKVDHGHTLYDELIRVPLIIRIPGISGARIESQVETLGIMPTILDLVARRVNESVKIQMRGEDMVPLMQGKANATGVDAYSETDLRLYTHKRSIRTTDGWKFIYTFAEYPDKKDVRELYNIKADPSEQLNLIASEPRIAYELEQKLFSHLDSIGADTRGPWEIGCIPVYTGQCV